MDRLPILMYHRIASLECPVPRIEERPWAISLAEFEWQLEQLRRSGFRAVSMALVDESLARGRPLPDDCVVLTFDDGNLSDFVHARPLLNARGFAATFFVTGQRIGRDDGLTAAMLAQMKSEGLHIGTHGMSHRFLTTLSRDAERRELQESRDRLAEILSSAVDHFAPPGGRWNRRTKEALVALGYRVVCTSQFGYNSRARRRFAYRRIPITAQTTRARFLSIIHGRLLPMGPDYVRANALTGLRWLVGEDVYGKLRTLGGRR